MNKDELKPSWVKLRDQQEHIKELEQLIRDLDTFLEDQMPYRYHALRDGILLCERIRELNIIERKELLG